MNYRLSKFIAFAAGAAVGSVVTYKLVKAKYEQILDEIFSENEEDEDEDECTKDIEIDFDSPISWTLDGEKGEENTHFEVNNLPQALEILY